jgi:hypothetical protein
MANDYSLMAVFQQMGFFAPDVDPAKKEDIEHSITYAKAAARAQYKKTTGRTIIDCDTTEYFDAYKTTIKKAAWNVNYEETKKVDSKGGKIDFSGIMGSVLNGVVPQAQIDNTINLYNALEKSSSTAVSSFMSFWWQNSSQQASDTNFIVSPWYMNENGNIEMAVTFWGYNLHIDAWRSLFVSQHQESLKTSVEVVRAEFFTASWDDIKGVIVPMIQSHEQDVVRNTTLAW